MIAHAQKRTEDFVLAGDLFDSGQSLRLAQGPWQRQRALQTDLGGYSGVYKRIQRFQPEQRQHFPGFVGTRADVPAHEFVRMSQAVGDVRFL